MAAVPAEQLRLGAVVAAAGREVVAAVLADLDRELRVADAQRAPYRLNFHERCGTAYAGRVSSRHESIERANEALAANNDLDFVDVFGPSGDWLTRVGRDEDSGGRLVPASATDRLARRWSRSAKNDGLRRPRRRTR